MMEAADVIEILVATGVFTTLSTGLQWFFTRGRTKVDNAKAIQGMALTMLEPLHSELDQARVEVTNLRVEASKIRREFEQLLGWALTLKDILDTHHIAHPEAPDPVKDRL